MIPAPKKKYTVEEYIELLKSSDERFEYFDGELFSMAAGKFEHSKIASNIGRSLGNLLLDRQCDVLGGDMAVKTVRAFPFRLPDVTVVCGDPVIEKMQGIDTLVNPLLIVEVLSQSTGAYDHGEKFIAYQAIESFQEYLLVEQHRPHVTRYVRRTDGQWLRGDFIGLDAVVRLESLGVVLPLSEIYRMVKFPSAESADES